MYTHTLDADDQFETVGTLDIETDGFDGELNNLIAIGVGYYTPELHTPDIDVFIRAATDNSEIELVRAAFNWLDQHQPQGLITYNGRDFDLSFLRDRLRTLEARLELSLPGRHVDLYPPRRRAADLVDEKWPSLEDCLEAYELPICETEWNGSLLDGSRFGSELAPQYLAAIKDGDQRRLQEFERVIYQYAASDVEANIALYEADIGRNYTPMYNFE